MASPNKLSAKRVSRKFRCKEVISEFNVKNLVRTQSGRPAMLVVSAEDEFEKVGILEYETGRREVRRRASFNKRFHEDCALGKCDIFKRVLGDECVLTDITHVKCVYHPRIKCKNGKDCILWRALKTGSFEEHYLAHAAIYEHPDRLFLNKFPAGFSYFIPLPEAPKTGRDPIYSFCHQFNDDVFQDPYCEDFGTQSPKEALEEFLIEIRENGMGSILHRDGENIIDQLEDFKNASEYLKELNHPLATHHLLAIILFTDTRFQFEYCSNTFLLGIMHEKWKHFFCVMKEAITILAQHSPMVGQHIHVCVPGINPADRDHSISAFVLGSKHRIQRFAKNPHTMFDIYLPHQHHRVGSNNVCAGVADVGWLSRFVSEELVIIMPGQCFIPESCDVEEYRCQIYGTLRGNCIVKKGEELRAAIVEEITINFGSATSVEPRPPSVVSIPGVLTPDLYDQSSLDDTCEPEFTVDDVSLDFSKDSATISSFEPLSSVDFGPWASSDMKCQSKEPRPAIVIHGPIVDDDGELDLIE